jgi:hypothetical protein
MQGEWPPHVIDTIYRQLSQFGRVGATKVYAVPDLGAALGLGPSSQQAPVLQFRESGIVIAMYGQELAGTAPKFATTRVRVQIGGQDDLFTDGNVGVGRSMLSLFGGAQNWWPMWRRAEPGINWVVTYSNLDTANTCTPEVSFAFLADADIARYAR